MRIVEAELRAAQKNPVHDCVYALDDFCENKALGLYNCLVPQIKGHSLQWGNVTQSIEKRGIRKETEIKNLVKMDMRNEEKQYSPTVLQYKNQVLKHMLDEYMK